MDSVTLTEIKRQQKGWKEAFKYLETKSENVKVKFLKYKNRTWIFTGCGTSLYIAQTASYCFTKITGIQSKAVAASEVIISPEIVFPNDEFVLVPISRSGTTTEIVLAARKSGKEFSIPTIAVSCTSESELVGECDNAITFPFQREESVVMTGSFLTMLLSIIYLALELSEDTNEKLRSELTTLPDGSEKLMLSNELYIKEIACKLDLNEFVFLGQGPMYGLANEAALKMQEMTISVAQGYHTLEYRHGPKSTCAENTFAAVMLSDNGFDLEAKLIPELKDFGASTLVLYSDTEREHVNKADFKIEIPKGYSDLMKPFFYLPLLQLLGYYRAVAKGINPDSPKNLTQVVKF
ncbi:MAG: SIS domain-containing protein [Ignavibacteriales bacterium]|nr:MAG: SIS domain-containing protein [Ignavibacteriales bacterium]